MESSSSSTGVKPKFLDFTLKAINQMCTKSVFSSPSSPVIARLSEDAGVGSLQFLQDSKSIDGFNVDLETMLLTSTGRVSSICFCLKPVATNEFPSYKIEFRNEDEKTRFHSAFEQWKKGYFIQGASLKSRSCSCTNPGAHLQNKFDDKIDPAYAKLYFQYYGQLLHQQNILEDHVMTGHYYDTIIGNRVEFKDRVVVDVGAGSGILSLFAAQAGAKHVYAVEASEMAEFASKLIAGNPALGQRITVIKSKVEEVCLPEKADILISEPLGTLLVNERMIESYIIARDRFLSPKGKMFPSIGRIHMALFSDEDLFVEIASKALFWQQHSYFGVDLRPLYESALQANFSQPVVDAFDPRSLVSPILSHEINFKEIKEEDLYEIDIPLNFIASAVGLVHGLACWFEAVFEGSVIPRWLTTSPFAPTTHWYQTRCVLSQPIHVMAGQEVTGRLHMMAHNTQSYTIDLTLSAKMWGPEVEQGRILHTSSCKFNLKDPYFRMLRPQFHTMEQDEQTIDQDEQTMEQDEQLH